MASMKLAIFLCIFATACLTPVYSEGEGSGDESGENSGTDSMFDVTEVVTELVTDSGDSEDTPSDIQGYGLVVSNDFTEFVLDIDNIVTYSFTLKNAGGTAIAAAAEGDTNFDLSVVVSDNADPTSNDATTMTIVPLLTATTNLGAGISAGGTILIENVHTMINIANDECSTYEDGYVCVVASKVSGASFTDSDDDNNYYCLPFGAVDDGNTGTLACSACNLKTSLMLLVLSSLLAFLWSS